MTSLDIRPRPIPWATASSAGPTLAAAVGPAPIDGRWELLDRLPCGVAIVCTSGRVLASNAAAREAVASGRHGLCLDGDVLRAESLWAEALWREALCDAVDGRTRLVRLGDALPIGLAGWTDARGRVAAACTFPAPAACIETLARAYGALHRLTAGETDVLHGLVDGLEPKRIAHRRGSSEATVRSQIKSVLAKTGCHGLRELVGAVLRQPPLLRGADDGPADGAARGTGGRHLGPMPVSGIVPPPRG